jgi:hypothetical protein
MVTTASVADLLVCTTGILAGSSGQARSRELRPATEQLFRGGLPAHPDLLHVDGPGTSAFHEQATVDEHVVDVAGRG